MGTCYQNRSGESYCVSDTESAMHIPATGFSAPSNAAVQDSMWAAQEGQLHQQWAQLDSRTQWVAVSQFDQRHGTNYAQSLQAGSLPSAEILSEWLYLAEGPAMPAQQIDWASGMGVGVPAWESAPPSHIRADADGYCYSESSTDSGASEVTGTGSLWTTDNLHQGWGSGAEVWGNSGREVMYDNGAYCTGSGQRTEYAWGATETCTGREMIEWRWNFDDDYQGYMPYPDVIGVNAEAQLFAGATELDLGDGGNIRMEGAGPGAEFGFYRGLTQGGARIGASLASVSVGHTSASGDYHVGLSAAAGVGFGAEYGIFEGVDGTSYRVGFEVGPVATVVETNDPLGLMVTAPVGGLFWYDYATDSLDVNVTQEIGAAVDEVEAWAAHVYENPEVILEGAEEVWDSGVDLVGDGLDSSCDYVCPWRW